MVVTMVRHDWYRALRTLPNGAVAVGYGKDYGTAVADCMRDIQVIRSIQ